ncbi:threonine dehydrogenase-like Zn-dependent dehydrogenase [Shimia isoporae]|uniref:Threonine dehydrogenase-like Zn-dependent dehydrogenase n=2 Tax=Shimia isoporae TaxID=647720 RepID=A0A4R1NYF0_9RHOB|nr:threonine dehydrogenase-like Zn-dependent dehydrogenase [Shimia isoporae]
MRALAITSIGRTAFQSVEPPRPRPDEVLLKVGVVGLCGSDLNTFRGANPLANLPRVPGHEIGGTILQAGEDVPTETSMVGRRAVVIPYTACGRCSACRQSRTNACKHNQTLGVQRDGGMATQIAVPHTHLILNDKLPMRDLALVEPLSVGFHAVRRGAVCEGDTVVVLGAGMIGVGAILGAIAAGARVIAVEISDSKRETLSSMGADAVINPVREDLSARIEELTNGHGADVVIEAVGLPETFRSAIDLACFAGRVVYVGYAKTEVSYNTALFNLKELDILGSRNANRVDFEAVIEFLEKSPDMSRQLVSKVFLWSEADQAFGHWEANRHDTFKILVDMQGAENE